MNRVVHFEIATPDVDTSIRFYREAFGWKMEPFAGSEGYWWVRTNGGSHGIDGGIQPIKDNRPRTVNTIEVASIDEAVRRVLAAGGQVVRPKMAIPGVGFHAYCADPTGLIFGLMQPEPEAK